MRFEARCSATRCEHGAPPMQQNTQPTDMSTVRTWRHNGKSSNSFIVISIWFERRSHAKRNASAARCWSKATFHRYCFRCADDNAISDHFSINSTSSHLCALLHVLPSLIFIFIFIHSMSVWCSSRSSPNASSKFYLTVESEAYSHFSEKCWEYGQYGQLACDVSSFRIFHSLISEFRF